MLPVIPCAKSRYTSLSSPQSNGRVSKLLSSGNSIGEDESSCCCWDGGSGCIGEIKLEECNSVGEDVSSCWC